MGQTVDQSCCTCRRLEGKAQLDPFDVICLFGESDPSVLSWAEEKPGRFVVILDTDERRFLERKSSPLAERPHVHLFCYRPDNPLVLKEIAWEFVFLRFGYFIREETRQEEAQTCFAALDHYHQGVDLLASAYQDRGQKVLENVLANLALLPVSKRGPSLEGACKGMTAIVCGAGPSLNRLTSQLAAVHDQALIIAGGSAAAALHAQGITPHLIAAIDPDPSLTRFLEQGNFETPFVYQSRFSHSLLQKVHGPLVWMPSTSLIPLESHVLGACGLYEEAFDAGWTAANFCTALAVHLGCERIAFAGVDFSASSPQEIYASELSAQEHQKGALIELQKGIYSRKDWVMSADWTRCFVASHPTVQWGNLSSAPYDLLGVPSLSVKDWFDGDTAEQEDLLGKVHALIARAETCATTSDQVKRVRAEVRQSFETGWRLCGILLDLWRQSYPASARDDAKYIVIEHDLEQEMCYVQCLSPLWEVWKYSILRAEKHPLAREVHKLLFFQQLLDTHLSYLRSY